MSLVGATLPPAESPVAFVSGEWACALEQAVLAADFRGEIEALLRGVVSIEASDRSITFVRHSMKCWLERSADVSRLIPTRET